MLEIDKDKLSVAWPAVNKQNAPQEDIIGADYVSSSLDNLGLQMLDLIFDLIGAAQTRSEISDEAARELRRDALVAAFSYPRDSFL